MDMSKYRGMFLTETREHLATMSRLILALEKNPADAEGIDALFREAHSVKGMAASMGYQTTARLAHHLEDQLDGCRKSGSVSAALTDVLLSGLDLLEGLLEDLSADRPERDVAAFLAAAIPAAPAAAAAKKPASPAAPRPVSHPALPNPAPPIHAPSAPTPEIPALVPAPAPAAVAADAAAADAGVVLRLTIELAVGIAAPAARALLILKTLDRLGRRLDCEPSEAQIRQGQSAHRLKLRLQTSRTPLEVERGVAAMTDVARIEVTAEETREVTPIGRGESGRTVRVRTDLLDRFINLTGELITSRYMLQTAAQKASWSDLRAQLEQHNRVIAELHHHVLQVRMMPLESITGRLPRLVRDLARRSGKEVELQVVGEGVELDRAILEQLADPLVHLVRNAVDHGIEQRGTVTVRAWREKDLAMLEVLDNGRGIDPEVIRRKAVERGLVSEAQSRGMRERDLLMLICKPGFSTAAAITETSGRGVGMDVVKSAVEHLGGVLEIDGSPGRGTRMLLKLPLSVAIIKILLIECAGRTLGMPVTRVLRTLEVDRGEVQSSGRQLVLRLDQEAVPLLSLSKILGLPGAPFSGSVPIVLSEVRGRRVGLAVDRLLGQREVFVKALNYPLDRHAGATGATVLGDGRVVFIIDPQHLLEERRGSRLHPAGEKA
ncbi:MAG: chemotaxis protein CheA [Trichloromonadaceae bacterium]